MTDLAQHDWRLIPEDVRRGPIQMALDEVAAETAAAGGPRTVRVYTWEPGTLSLGYTQDPATVDWGACERAGIPVVRRQTGGGGIYHDRDGDVSYSVVAPAAELPGNLQACYELLCEPLFDALADLGVVANFAETAKSAVYKPACYLRAVDPAHDVVGPGGRKLSGNAQYRRRESIVQHGSLTHRRAVDRHLAVFAADIDPDTFRSRVTSVHEQVGCDRAATVAALEDAFADWADADIGSWQPAELDRARELVERKYGTDAWTQGEGRGEGTTRRTSGLGTE